MPKLKSTARPELPRDFGDLVRLSPPVAIHDEVAYQNAQEIVDALTEIPSPSKGQLKYLDTLSVLVEAYESERHGFDPRAIAPLDVLRHLMQEHGMSASDLGRLLGERSLGSKILTGMRQISKSHITRLAAHFNVSPAVFF
jgi:HTH-type transcriptional regulator / antitoxin HigA